jgi:prepilin-type N-terminal cleavage/methylation domain-containing protein
VRKSVSGFTLIELVIVIIILGILAATATARYINLRGDSLNSVNEATAGALRSAIEVARMKLITTYQTIPEFGWIESGDPATNAWDLGFYKGNPECHRLSCVLNGQTVGHGCDALIGFLLAKKIPYYPTMQWGSDPVRTAAGDVCVFNHNEDPDYKFRYSITDGTVVTSQP